MSKGKFSLIPRLTKPSINPGESIIVHFYISGFGEIPDDDKIYITSTIPDLFKEDKEGKIGTIQTSIKGLKDDEGKLVSALIGDNTIRDKETGNEVTGIEVSSLDGSGAVGRINLSYFLPYKKYLNYWKKEWEEKDTRIMGEMRHRSKIGDFYYPITITLNTSTKAPEGDHTLIFTFFYNYAEDIHMDQKLVNIHVNTWIERHSKLLQKIAIFLGSVGLVATVADAYLNYLQLLKR